MAQQYNFESLSGTEFQLLCRDLLQRKISEETGEPFYFNSFSEGKDRGIDGIFQNKKETIILQCKRYKDFKSLYAQLKKIELQKIKLLNPSRYILTTSVNLSESQIQKLFSLLTPFIQNINDIMGQAMINNLLSNYPEIELNYPKLYFNSINVFKRIINAYTFNQSGNKIKEYYKLSKYYVADNSFQQAINILERKKYVVISGDPGVGKSALAGMLAIFFVGKDYEFIFLRRSIAEGNKLWQEDKKQIFLFDDFLGSTSFEGFERNEDRELLDFIKNVSGSKDKLFLITTREYIFKKAIQKYPELNKLDFNKCIITQKEFTGAFKVNLLYNYLYYSTVEFKHIESLLFDGHYKFIINHQNFSPRLISDFLERIYDKSTSGWSFYDGFKKHLDEPFEYWKNIFVQLSNDAQIILLILSITEQPGLEEILFETFKNVGKYRKLFEQGYEKETFEQGLKELSESFVVIRYNPELRIHENYITSSDYSFLSNPFCTSRYIEFYNPSIKDFAITFLKDREDLIEYLLRGAVLFHQLFFVFATEKDDKFIEDYDDDYPYSVHKILLSPHLQKILTEKAIAEFDKLSTMRFKKISWKNGDDTYHIDGNDDDNRMEKLWLLSNHFPLKYFNTVREFVIGKYFKILEEDAECNKNENLHENLHRSLSFQERSSQVDVIFKLEPFVKFDPLQTVNNYYENIRFSKEFLSLSYLEKLFPEAYKTIITNNIKQVRKKIKSIIIDDIDYYMWESTHEAQVALDELIDEHIEQLTETYKFRLSQKFKVEVNEMTGEEIFRLGSNNQHSYSDDSVEEERNIIKSQDEFIKEHNKQKYKSYKNALIRLTPNWNEFTTKEDAFNYLQTNLNTNHYVDFYKKLSSNKDLAKDLLDSPEQIDVLVRSFPSGLKGYCASSFYNIILDKANLSQEIISYLIKAAHLLYIENSFIFRKESFKKILKKDINEDDELDKILNILLDSNLIIQDDIWYKILSHSFHIYLAARYIIGLPHDEKALTYKNFECLYKANNIPYDSNLWQYFFELDARLFKQHFLLPVLKNYLEFFENFSEDKKPIKFLEHEDFSITYSYWEEEKCFELDSASGGDVLLEEICRNINLEIVYPFELLEDCFNVSRNMNKAITNYIKKHCQIKDKTYTIEIIKELRVNNFQKIIQSSEVVSIILNYLNKLKNCVNTLNYD